MSQQKPPSGEVKDEHQTGAWIYKMQTSPVQYTLFQSGQFTCTVPKYDQDGWGMHEDCRYSTTNIFVALLKYGGNTLEVRPWLAPEYQADEPGH